MIDNTYFWIIVAILSVGTFLIRFSIIAAAHKVKITQRHKEIFSFIPAAVFPALAFPMVFYHQGTVTWLGGKERFAVFIMAIVFNFFVRSLTATIGLGLIALYLLTQI